MENYEVKVSQQAGAISCDFEAAKAYLEERLAEYNGVVFTEDSKKDAKAAVADLRKEKKAFSDRVKTVKEEYMKPFNAFAEQATELLNMYDKPIDFINQQVSDFEKKRIEEKREKIKEWYAECIDDMQEILPLARIYNVKWENATMNPTQVRKEMMERKAATVEAINAIKEMKTDIEAKAIQMYIDSFDLTKVILYINQHEQQKKEILEREQERLRQEEAERIRREERQKIEAEINRQRELEEAKRKAEEEKAAAVEKAREEAVESLIPDLTGESNLYEYRISLTEEAKEKLEMYMTSVGIEWELI